VGRLGLGQLNVDAFPVAGGDQFLVGSPGPAARGDQNLTGAGFLVSGNQDPLLALDRLTVFGGADRHPGVLIGDLDGAVDRRHPDPTVTGRAGNRTVRDGDEARTLQTLGLCKFRQQEQGKEYDGSSGIAEHANLPARRSLGTF